jgi:hypothetical protein
VAEKLTERKLRRQKLVESFELQTSKRWHNSKTSSQRLSLAFQVRKKAGHSGRASFGREAD